MKSPCELVVWCLLPAIRSELAKALKEERFTQKQIACKLGISSAAVSQYISEKRGCDFEFSPEIKEMINALSKKIADEDISEFLIMEEICVICLEARKTGLLCEIHRNIDREIPDKCDFWGKIEKCIKMQ